MTTTAQIASTSAIVDLPTSRGASLLAISKGLPPPLLSCDCDCGEEVVWVDVVEVFFEVVVADIDVVAGLPPRPPSADCNCDVVVVEVVAVLVAVVIVDCA